MVYHVLSCFLMFYHVLSCFIYWSHIIIRLHWSRIYHNINHHLSPLSLPRSRSTATSRWMSCERWHERSVAEEVDVQIMGYTMDISWYTDKAVELSISGWWFGNVWNMNGLLFYIFGISSSQLTNSFFSEGWLNHQADMFVKINW